MKIRINSMCCKITQFCPSYVIQFCYAGSADVELDALDDVERGGVVSVEATETNTEDSSLLKGIIFPVKGKISSADSTELDSRQQ